MEVRVFDDFERRTGIAESFLERQISLGNLNKSDINKIRSMALKFQDSNMVEPYELGVILKFLRMKGTSKDVAAILRYLTGEISVVGIKTLFSEVEERYVIRDRIARLLREINLLEPLDLKILTASKRDLNLKFRLVGSNEEVRVFEDDKFKYFVYNEFTSELLDSLRKWVALKGTSRKIEMEYLRKNVLVEKLA